MTCNEFEELGLDAERDASLSGAQRTAAASHAASCPRCAALRDSWEATRIELQSIAQATDALDAPARVEMRLRQQFRTQHHSPRARRTAVVATWGLAAAAVLVGGVSWVKWHNNQARDTAFHATPTQAATVSPPIEREGMAPTAEAAAQPKQNVPVGRQRGAAKNTNPVSLAADNGLGGFTRLPGFFPLDYENSEILRVRLQRATLESFGLPVNEERAGEWIQVDLLVGNDGLPEAVRLSR